MKKTKPYSAILNELKRYSSHINGIIEDGTFYSLPFARRFVLIRRVKKLYSQMRGPVSDVNLRRILAGAAVLVLGLSCRTVGAQDSASDESGKTFGSGD